MIVKVFEIIPGAYTVIRKCSISGIQDVVIVPSASCSSLGSSSSGNCIDQRQRLRRMAQRQASGIHHLSSMQHFQWNWHIDTSIGPIAERVSLPEDLQILSESDNSICTLKSTLSAKIKRCLICSWEGKRCIHYKSWIALSQVKRSVCNWWLGENHPLIHWFPK